MRKSVVTHSSDCIFWHLILLFPLIGYVVYLMPFNDSAVTPIPLIDFMSSIGFGNPLLVDGNPIYKALLTLFGDSQGSFFGLFATNDVLWYFSYIGSIHLVHLAVDFILFIPKLCTKWIDKYTESGGRI